MVCTHPTSQSEKACEAFFLASRVSKQTKPRPSLSRLLSQRLVVPHCHAMQRHAMPLLGFIRGNEYGRTTLPSPPARPVKLQFTAPTITLIDGAFSPILSFLWSPRPLWAHHIYYTVATPAPFFPLALPIFMPPPPGPKYNPIPPPLPSDPKHTISHHHHHIT